ncbi:phage tail protein [Nitratireductor luteus]|uniref:phage tail protein n=1 Tax=Nitratireductor luteus TaxID=2976980 RepID=UPI00224026F5|nr:phage tail protein [Nitratireductor luteus]
MILRILITALALLLAATAHADAGPVVAAIGAIAAGIGKVIAAGGFLGALVKGALTLALQVGYSLIQRALQKDQEQLPTGVQIDVEIGDDAPVGTVVGSFATAGTRKYAGSWGRDGKTPNAYLTDVIEIGNLPAPGQPGIWVNGELCTILWGEPPTEQGYPVEEFRQNGKDHLWVWYKDGTQTVADPYLRAKFGNHPDRPWKETMIGRGCPHVIVTALVNRDIFRGQMEWLIEPPLLHFYDLRKDSTNGGSGAHRWHDQSTWEPTNNNAVVAYNIIRGIYYDNGAGYREWFYGGQDLAAFRLPASSWMAAANECDAQIPLEGGGQENQFRCGYEIRGDMEPLAVAQELLKGASARLAEVGGIFKVLVGAPGAAVYSFSDADTVITKGQSLRPFPSLGETYNGIEATYPEPAEMWRTKDAPARFSSVLEAEDGNRRLATGVNFAASPFAIQVQRLMKAMIEEERRFRIHSFFLPPEAWLLEPNDVVSWTSASNGYTNKKFLVVRIEGEPGMNQLVLLKEINPSDYGWNPATDQQPTSTGFLGPIHTPAQLATGFQVAPATFFDAAGKARRPSIEAFFAGDLDDVQFVRVVVRLAETQAIVYSTDEPYGEPGPDDQIRSIILNGVFLPDTLYEVTGQYIPYSGRITLPSAWLPVTTPDVRLGADDISVYLASLQQEVRDYLKDRWAEADEIFERMETLAANVGSANVDDIVDRKRHEKAIGRNAASITRESVLRVDGDEALAQEILTVQANVDDNAASIVQEQQARVTADDALASDITAVQAIADAGTAQGLMRWLAGAGPTGVTTRFTIQGKATAGDTYRTGGAYLDVTPTEAFWTFEADKVFFANPANANQKVGIIVFEDGVATLNGIKAEWADIVNVIIGWADIGTAVVNNFVATSANIGDLSVDTIKLAGSAINVSNSFYDGAPLHTDISFVTMASVTLNVPDDALVVRMLFSAVTSNLNHIPRINYYVDGLLLTATEVRYSPFYSEAVWLSPSGGNHTFEVKMLASGAAPGQGFDVSQRRLHVYAQRR